MIRPLPEPTFRSIEDEDWMAAWKQHYHPIPIGKKLEVLPAWIEKHDETRIAVHIDPSMAFGTGTHPSPNCAWKWWKAIPNPASRSSTWAAARAFSPSPPLGWAPATPWASISTMPRLSRPTRMPPPTKVQQKPGMRPRLGHRNPARQIQPAPGAAGAGQYPGPGHRAPV